MGVYPEYYEMFAYLNALGMVICGPLAILFNYVVASNLEHKVMIRPLLCFFKAFCDCILAYFIFMQRDSFKLTMIALFLSYLFGKAW